MTSKRSISFFTKTLIRLTWQMVALIIGSFFVSSMPALAADVVYLTADNTFNSTRMHLETAGKFYGLGIKEIIVSDSQNIRSVSDAVHSVNTIALVIHADALRMLDRATIFNTIKASGHAIPLLIAGINDQTDATLLMRWSDGGINGSGKSDLALAAATYFVSNVRNIARELAGSKLPTQLNSFSYLRVAEGHGVQRIIAAQVGKNNDFPLLAHTIISGQDLFFSAEVKPTDVPLVPDPFRQQAVFGTLVSPLLFLRYAAKDRAWHSPGTYANLTIDDLWLREPYGHVYYEALLKQAQLHNFHATIAFIPWNFDRSEARLVSLFRDNSDRLTIAVHGNNHVHQEFGPLLTHPLEQQRADIKQALGRMVKFSELTEVPYDQVMVFPHSIAPQATLALLKHYNFLATANSLNVPSDAETPSDAEFALRTATLQFANFPSLRRYSAENYIPRPQLAIDAFLGNPMLFYVHESYFAPGIDTFSPVADTVNHIEPNIQWKSLGYISRHLYLEKARDDGDIDISSYSADIQITNTLNRRAIFYIEKKEDFTQPLTVLVDGHSYPFQRVGTYLRLQLPLAAGDSREITVRYDNDFNLAIVPIAKNSTKVRVIRLLSDFRDDLVAKTKLGRWFIRSYAKDGSDWNYGMGIMVGLIVILLALRNPLRVKINPS